MLCSLLLIALEEQISLWDLLLEKGDHGLKERLNEEVLDLIGALCRLVLEPSLVAFCFVHEDVKLIHETEVNQGVDELYLLAEVSVDEEDACYLEWVQVAKWYLGLALACGGCHWVVFVHSGVILLALAAVQKLVFFLVGIL